jgi:HAD superfamily hydrolase (TIGR01509 family)
MIPDVSRIEALLFDMDGVVIDSEPIHEEAQRIIFSEHGLAVPEALYPSFKGMTEQKVFEQIVSEYGSAHHDAATLVLAKEETYRRLLVDLQLVPGVLDFLELAQSRFRMALTTSSVRENQRIAFERFDLDGYFEVVVAAEDIEHPKPHPQPYLTTADKLGVPPKACLVLEDSLHGVRSAKRAGCRIAGMTTSFEAAALKHAGADVTVDSFGELAERLGLSAAWLRSDRSPDAHGAST